MATAAANIKPRYVIISDPIFVLLNGDLEVDLDLKPDQNKDISKSLTNLTNSNVLTANPVIYNLPQISIAIDYMVTYDVYCGMVCTATLDDLNKDITWLLDLDNEIMDFLTREEEESYQQSDAEFL